MKIVLTGGGTGGHIYPALTLWRYMVSQLSDVQVLYIGSDNGLEKQIVAHESLPFEAIPAAGLRRQLSLQAVRTALTTYRGYRRARKLLKQFRPDVVVGTGGYVTLPVIYAAHARKIPSVIWEGNARPGLTNQLCANKADAVAVCFEDSVKWFRRARTVHMTGNPRASEVLDVPQEMLQAARAAYDIDPARRLVVCFAGSRGAETVNEVLVSLFPRFTQRPDWQLVCVTGEKHFRDVRAVVPDLPANVQLVPFIHDMPAVLAQASVVMTRAGSATLAEICSLGLASILIPSPYVTANHQEENALRLARRGAAKMIRERDLAADTLWDALRDILDTETGAALRLAAKQMATPNAVQDLFEIVMNVSGQTTR